MKSANNSGADRIYIYQMMVMDEDVENVRSSLYIVFLLSSTFFVMENLFKKKKSVHFKPKDNK